MDFGRTMEPAGYTDEAEAESAYPAGSIVRPKSIVQLTCTTSGLDVHDVQSLAILRYVVQRHFTSCGRIIFLDDTERTNVF